MTKVRRNKYLQKVRNLPASIQPNRLHRRDQHHLNTVTRDILATALIALRATLLLRHAKQNQIHVLLDGEADKSMNYNEISQHGDIITILIEIK